MIRVDWPAQTQQDCLLGGSDRVQAGGELGSDQQAQGWPAQGDQPAANDPQPVEEADRGDAFEPQQDLAQPLSVDHQERGLYGAQSGCHLGVAYTTDAGYRQGPEIYESYSGLAIAVESECAAAAVVGARLGLEMGALLFCSDNTTLPKSEDQVYGGLRNPATRRGFEAGAAALVEVLSVGDDVRK